MARYDYQCPSCGTRFEIEHPMSTHPKVTCPKCGREAEHVFESSGIVFKGSGFYNTDQRSK
jgi:putative FmdB family regulatory protein